MRPSITMPEHTITGVSFDRLSNVAVIAVCAYCVRKVSSEIGVYLGEAFFGQKRWIKHEEIKAILQL